MTLSRATIDAHAEEYEAEEPLYAVEQEQVATLPSAIADGRYGWRDVAWVVRWYYRRHLGAYPDDERRAVEDAFGDNDYETIHETIEAVLDARDVGSELRLLTSLEGVDVGVASGLLMFADPDDRIAVGRREWGALVAAGELAGDPPTTIDAAAYGRYLEACRSVCDRTGCSMWALYRALWRLGDSDA